MFYCTRLDWDARQILSTYACRWAIECTFSLQAAHGPRGTSQPRAEAIERTRPMAFFLIVVWNMDQAMSWFRFPLSDRGT